MIQPRTLATILIVPVLALVTLNLLLGGLLFFGVDPGSTTVDFLRFFDLNAEGTVPTWYNTLLLAGAAVATFLAWYRTVSESGEFQRAWLMLAILFLYLSMDESLAIHEKSMGPLREAFNAGGFFYWAWVIPGIFLVIIIAFAFIPFLRHLPVRTFWLVVAAGGLYVGGALVLEMVGGYFYDTYGAGVLSDVTATIEEFGEMSGLILFIYAIHDYLSTSRLGEAN